MKKYKREDYHYFLLNEIPNYLLQQAVKFIFTPIFWLVDDMTNKKKDPYKKEY